MWKRDATTVGFCCVFFFLCLLVIIGKHLLNANMKTVSMFRKPMITNTAERSCVINYNVRYKQEATKFHFMLDWWYRMCLSADISIVQVERYKRQSKYPDWHKNQLVTRVKIFQHTCFVFSDMKVISAIDVHNFSFMFVD